MQNPDEKVNENEIKNHLQLLKKKRVNLGDDDPLKQRWGTCGLREHNMMWPASGCSLPSWNKKLHQDEAP